MSGPDIGASVRPRLLAKAKAGGQDFNLVLTRYALERLLYRLGASRYVERFLKQELYASLEVEGIRSLPATATSARPGGAGSSPRPSRSAHQDGQLLRRFNSE